MKLWVHLEGGIVRGLMAADGRVPHEELARELGEWVLMGIQPILYDFGDLPAKVNQPLPVDPQMIFPV